MSGSNGADKMDGLGKRDAMRGDRGSDTIDGGRGDGTIMADDGELDSISCGSGTDSVYVDRADVDAEGTDIEDLVRLTSCETVVEPPVDQTQLTTP